MPYVWPGRYAIAGYQGEDSIPGTAGLCSCTVLVLPPIIIILHRRSMHRKIHVRPEAWSRHHTAVSPDSFTLHLRCREGACTELGMTSKRRVHICGQARTSNPRKQAHVSLSYTNSSCKSPNDALATPSSRESHFTQLLETRMGQEAAQL